MSFRDIKLQDKAIEFLKRYLKANKLPHSLLFFGPDSVGKHSTALAIAKALNCEERLADGSCDRCSSCKRIEALNHPDVSWIAPEGAGNTIKIERIRALKSKIVLRPFEAASKVFIIDKAHLLKDEAANSILKILEEPPKDSYIILITDNLEKVFDTIRSRCQPIPFLSATPDALEELLKTDYSLTAQEAHFLARLAEGRIGSALKMKREDTLSWKNQVIDLFTQENIIVHQDPLFYNNKREELLGLIDILVGWCRDLFMLKNNVDQRLLVNVDRLQELNEKAHSFPTKEVRVMLEETLKTRAYIEENVNPKLALANLACQWYR